MWSLILYLLIGGGIGAALGYFGKCSSGGCPLTATWWRGAIYGALVAGLFYFASGGNSSASMNQSTENVKRIGASQFETQVIQSALPVVVDFYATWCGPCKILGPRLDQLAGSYTNRIRFVKVNVDEASALARQYDIQAIPTLLFFKDGKVTDRLVGLPATEDLKERLEKFAGANGAAKIDS